MKLYEAERNEDGTFYINLERPEGLHLRLNLHRDQVYGLFHCLADQVYQSDCKPHKCVFGAIDFVTEVEEWEVDFDMWAKDARQLLDRLVVLDHTLAEG